MDLFQRACLIDPFMYHTREPLVKCRSSLFEGPSSDAMASRYVMAIPQELLFEVFDLDEGGGLPPCGYNIAPSTRISVIRAEASGRRWMEGLRWGLRPCWSMEEDNLPLLINARAETVTIMPAFRSAYRTRRCLIPASGYYEWKRLPGGRKQPFYITRADGAPIALAGLWEAGCDGEPDTVAIITTLANRDTAAIHDRMPAMICREDWRRWLSPVPYVAEETARLFGPASSGQLIRWPVSEAVNLLDSDGPQLIESVSGVFRGRKRAVEQELDFSR